MVQQKHFPWSFWIPWHKLLRLTCFFSRNKSRIFTHSGCRWWRSQSSSGWLGSCKIIQIIYSLRKLVSLLWWFTNSAYPFLQTHHFCPIKDNLKETMNKKMQIGSSVPSLFCHGMSTLGSPKVRWISRMFRPSVAASCPPPCAKCPETPSRSSLLPGWHSCGIRRGFWAQSVGGWKGTRKVES